jgi:hypothetical protein
MSVLDSLCKGFGFLLMSFGISSPAKKAKPAPKPITKAGSTPPEGETIVAQDEAQRNPGKAAEQIP